MAYVIINVRSPALDAKFLFKCLFSILTVQQCMLNMTSAVSALGQYQHSFANLLDDDGASTGYDDDKETTNIVQRTSSGVNVDQFNSIKNDIEVFHKATLMRLEKIDSADKTDFDHYYSANSDDEELAKEYSPGLLDSFTQAFKDFVAPARDYYSLLGRYGAWRNNYRRLQIEFGNRTDGRPILKNAVDVLRIEYAKIDHELMTQICNGQPAEDAKLNELKSENIDFILNIFRQLIVRLEARLEDLRRKGREGVLNDERLHRDDERFEVELIEIDRSVQVASHRVKRIAAQSVAQLAARETMTLVKLLTFNWLASYVKKDNSEKSKDHKFSLMRIIEPIILTMGNPDASLLVSYLRDIKFRTTLSLLNRFLSKLECRLNQP